MSAIDQSPHKRNVWLKRAAWALGIVLAFILFVLVAARFAASSPIGRNFVEARIEAASVSGQKVQIEGLSGDLLGALTISQLSISDADGVWLTAENLNADWSPLALRKRSLKINALEIEHLDILRQPQLQSTSSDQSSGSSPIRMADLEMLAIDTLTLHEGLAPREVSLKVQGAAQYQIDRGQVTLTVLPKGAVQDRILADLSWDPENLLQGNADVYGAPGGAISGLARLGPNDILEAKLEASGGVETWATRLVASVNGNEAITAEAKSREADIEYSAAIQLAAHPVSAEYADWAGKTVSIAGTAERRNETTALDVTVEAERLLGSGRVTLMQDGDLSADIIAEATAPHLLLDDPGISIDQIMLDGTIARDSSEMSFDGDISVLNFEQGTSRIDRIAGPVSIALKEGVVNFDVNATGNRPALDNAVSMYLGDTPYLAANGKYGIESQTLNVSSMTLKLPTLMATAKGALHLDHETPRADMSGTIDFDGAKAELSRPVSIEGTWSAQTGNANTIATSFNGRVSGFGELPDIVEERLSDRADVSINASVALDGQITLTALSASSGVTDLQGSGARNTDGTLSADLTLMSDSIVSDGPISNQLNVKANLNGRLEKLSITASAETPSVQIGDTTMINASTSFIGIYDEQGLSGDGRVSGDTDRGGAAINSRIGLQGSDWSLSDIKASFAGLNAAGSASGAGGDLAAIRADLTINGRVPEGLPADTIAADILITGANIDIDGQVSGVASGPLVDGDISFKATGKPERVYFTLGIDGKTEIVSLERNLSATFSGVGVDVLTQARAMEGELSGAMGQLSLATTQPIKFAQVPAGYNFSGAIEAFSGDIAFDLGSGLQRTLSVDIAGISLGDVMALAGRAPRDGTISAKIDLAASSTGAVEGTLNGAISGLRQLSGRLSPLEVKFVGDLSRDVLDMRLLTVGDSGFVGRVNAQIPVATDASTFLIMPSIDSGVAFQADLDGRVGPIAAVLAPADIEIAGDVAVNLQGTYPLFAGSIDGDFSLTGGTFEHGTAGLYLDQIELAGDITGERLRLSTFSAKGRENGRLSGGGQMSLTGGASDLNIKVDRLLAIDRREAKGIVSGDLKLERTSTLTSLTGELDLVDGRINIDRLPRGREPTLDVSFGETPPEEALAEQNQAITRMDVKITSKRGIDVVGLGVNAALGLNARVTGTLSAPVIDGSASIVRGRFDFLGKRFEFSDSRITIDGDPSKAQLDITATRQTNDLTAIIRVTGTADDPKADVSSEPELPGDEVLSRILFGRSASQLSGLEAAQLAAAVAQLSGGGGFNLLGGIQDAIGLDTLSLDQSTSGSVEVTTGKYFADNVYLELRNGVEGSTGLAVEWTPLENVEVEAETTSDEGQSLSVQWTTDF